MKRLPKYLTQDPNPDSVKWEMARRGAMHLLRKARYVAAKLQADELRQRAIAAARADWNQGR